MRKIWTKREDRILAELYPDNPTLVVAKKLKRTYSAVSQRAINLGLKKSEAFMNSQNSGRIQKLSKKGEQYRFKKGHATYNKGKRWEEYMSQQAIERSRSTTFKKGNEPMNTKHDGYIRISRDGYEEIRVTKGKFVHRHRLIWEQNNGPIPKGMIVVFKDKNPRNLTIDNLELITRAENMKRNTIQRYPQEMVSTLKALGKLKKTIHGKEQTK